MPKTGSQDRGPAMPRTLSGAAAGPDALSSLDAGNPLVQWEPGMGIEPIRQKSRNRNPPVMSEEGETPEVPALRGPRWSP